VFQQQGGLAGVATAEVEVVRDVEVKALAASDLHRFCAR
jgi:hypothetical protein